MLNLNGKKWNGTIYKKNTEKVGSIYLSGDKIELTSKHNEEIAKLVLEGMWEYVGHSLDRTKAIMYGLLLLYVKDFKSIEEMFDWIIKQTNKQIIRDAETYKKKSGYYKYSFRVPEGKGVIDITTDIFKIIVKKLKPTLFPRFKKYYLNIVNDKIQKNINMLPEDKTFLKMTK